ncbi:beta-propeller fold lactonase family protein [Novosphingobium flavum]|uniref:Beta-propeller fold lactonase family protein n=1 Tax=Novosphingobium flavum TaxID=1778672 RepID=A0A7X1FR66_9SPHN|nr:beta-propeller fold lactonase family protein [Novosphingobium flavum]
MLYSSVGAQITRYEIDPDSAELIERESIALPSVVQYGWFSPSGRMLYVVTSDAPGGTVGLGVMHRLCSLDVSEGGRLTPAGAPVALPQRPIHLTMGPDGRFVFVAYNNPANLTVHPIGADGTAGEATVQDLPDLGIFPHQVRVLPGGRSLVLVTRGNRAKSARPEEPGALMLYRLDEGGVAPLAALRPGGNGGLGYGPRHLAFDPSGRWAYVAVELQSELHMHRIEGDSLAPEPDAVLPSTREAPVSGRHQAGGAIHVHPRGHAVYMSNRANGLVDYAGRKVFAGGENSIAVFAIDPQSGVPRHVQSVDPRGFQVRSFALDPAGTVLVAATLTDMLVQAGDQIDYVPAGLTLFRVLPDGRLDFAKRYPVATSGEPLNWVAFAPPRT